MKWWRWLRGDHRPKVWTLVVHPVQELKEFDIKLYEAVNDRHAIEQRLKPSGTMIADTMGGRGQGKE